jgi:hypothetical protein
MGNLIRFCIIQLIVLFSFSSSLFALGRGIAMGGMTSVVSDGPFDAAKNPALLSLQANNNALGIVLKYQNYLDSDISAEIDFAGVDADVDSEKLEGKSLGCFLAYSIKLGNPVIAFAVTDSGNGQYYLREVKSTFTVIAGVDQHKSKIIEDVEEYNPVFHTSIGFNISDRSSIGFRVSVRYSSKEDDENKRNFLNGSETALVDQKLTTNILSYSVGTGYLYREGGTQIGLLFYIGEFSWRKQELSYSFQDRDVPVPDPVDDSSSDSDSYSSSGKYTEGMRFVAGGYHRLNTFLAIALEGEFRIGNSFRQTELTLDEDESNDLYNIVEERNRVTNKNTVFLKGGAEINPISSISLYFGCAYADIMGRVGGGDGDGFLSNRYSLFLFTGGVNYQYTKNLSLFFGSLFIYVDAESDMVFDDVSGTVSLNSEEKGLDVLLGAGMVYSF